MSKVHIAILVRRNYWQNPAPGTGNGVTHRSVPDIMRAVRKAGATPHLIYQGTAPRHFQGVILPGGGDIHPHFYGHKPLGEDYDTELDVFQLNWARYALQTGTPVLGICRGMQVLNVVAGGTLIQDVPQHLPTRVVENPSLRGEAVHALELAGHSRLAHLLGTEVEVNSIHHQSLDRIGEPFQVVGWAPDGIVEAIENPQSPWQRGVQFHPEDMLPRFQGLFDSLVEDAAKF